MNKWIIFAILLAYPMLNRTLFVLVYQGISLNLLQGFLAASLLQTKIIGFSQIFRSSNFCRNTKLFEANQFFLLL